MWPKWVIKSGASPLASTPSVCTEAMNNSHTCGQLSAHKNGYVMQRPTLGGDERGGGGEGRCRRKRFCLRNVLSHRATLPLPRFPVYVCHAFVCVCVCETGYAWRHSHVRSVCVCLPLSAALSPCRGLVVVVLVERGVCRGLSSTLIRFLHICSISSQLSCFIPIHLPCSPLLHSLWSHIIPLLSLWLCYRRQMDTVIRFFLPFLPLPLFFFFKKKGRFPTENRTLGGCGPSYNSASEGEHYTVGTLWCVT